MACKERTLWAGIRSPQTRRLLDAAVDAFADRGYHGTTTREIAEKAGMSPAGVYVHFRSKADLLYEIARIGHSAALEAVEQAVVSAGTPAARVAAFVRAFTSWHALNHEAAKVIQYELGHLGGPHYSEIRAIRARFEQLLEEELASGIEDGTFQVENIQVARVALLSLGIDTARWYRPGVDIAPETLGDAYAKFALTFLRAPINVSG